MKIPAAKVVFDPRDIARVQELVAESLETGSLTLGPVTGRFEEEFAARHGAAHAVATSSGTSALEIMLRTVGVEGGEVVLPTNTFYATAAAVLHAGARPVFADISRDTFALSAATARAALSPETRAVIHVHIGGVVSSEIRDIHALCEERGMPLLEDAAHAVGCSFEGQFAGTFGIAGAFSFYPTKVVTSGEGGMILTDSAELRDEYKIFRDQGKAAFLGGEHVRLGSSWRMSELSAAVGLVHLGRMDEAIASRRRAAHRYDAGLAPFPGLRPLIPPAPSVCNYYKYAVILPGDVDRDVLKKEMREEHGVSLSGEVYSLPLHLQPVLAPYARSGLPVAEDVCSRHVCLPLYTGMTDAEVDHVLGSLKATMRGLTDRVG